MTVKTILVIDDEYLTRMTLADFLEEAGYNTTPVGDGKSAVQCQQMQPFDVCIVDIRIPGMNGTEIIAALHQISSHSRYIIYTGSPEFDLTPALKKTGITDNYVVRKPVPDMNIFPSLIEQLTNPDVED